MAYGHANTAGLTNAPRLRWGEHDRDKAVMTPFTIYWYRSISGLVVMDSTDKTPAQLEEQFKHSSTPLVQSVRVWKQDQLPLVERVVRHWTCLCLLALRSEHQGRLVSYLWEKLERAKAGK